MLEFHAEAPQATVNKGLAQGPYVMSKAGFEPTTLQTKGDASTNEPPHPTNVILLLLLLVFLLLLLLCYTKHTLCLKLNN